MNECDRMQRRFVADAGRKRAAGKISRREFIRRAALAGFGFSAANLMRNESVRAMTVAAPIRPDSYPVSDDQIAWLKEVGRKFAGSEIRIASESTAPSQIISALATNKDNPNSFENLTGMKIIWEQQPLDQVLSKIVQDTETGSPSHDIYYLDQAWLGRFVNDTVDPRKRLQDGSEFNMPNYDFDDFVPQLLPALASYQGRLVGLPFDIPIFIYIYRRDVYDSLGLKPATTMAEFLENVRATNGKDSASGTVHGYIGQWKSGHYSLQCDWTAWLWSHGGSHTGKDNSVTINDEAGVAGLNYMLELARYVPSAVIEWDWSGQGQAMSGGVGANAISWAELFPVLDNPMTSKTVGMWETADLPMEVALRAKDDTSFDETPAIGHQGGSCIALSRHSKQPDAAWIFLQWATSSPVQIAAAASSNTPIRTSAFDSDVVKAHAKVVAGTTRHFPAALKAIQTRMGTEPHFPGWVTASGTGGPIPTELGKITAAAVAGRSVDVKATLDRIAQSIKAAIK